MPSPRSHGDASLIPVRGHFPQHVPEVARRCMSKLSYKPGPNGRYRVFIVDDHPLVREWLAGLVGRESDLEICGQAGDAPTALASIPLAKPSLVVVDLSLNRSSGMELIKDLKNQFS